MNRKVLGLFLVLVGSILVTYKDKIYEGIVGKVSWQRIADFPDDSYQKKTAYSVAKVVIDFQDDKNIFRSRCSGFVVNNKYKTLDGSEKPLVMTNKHCIPDGLLAANFHFYNGAKAKCSDEIAHSEKYDFSLLSCEEVIGQLPKALNISPSYPSYGDGAIVSFNCDYYLNRNCQVFALIDEDSEGRQYRDEGDVIVHYSDSLGGSSGSPYFNKGMIDEDGRMIIIGIHNSARMNGDRGEHPASSDNNFAQPMKKIRPLISKYLPEYKLVTVKNQPKEDPKDNKGLLDFIIHLINTIMAYLGMENA